MGPDRIFLSEPTLRCADNTVPRGAYSDISMHHAKANGRLDDSKLFFPRLHVYSSFFVQWTAVNFIRYWKGIPDPLLGPKGVRTLLFLRGFAGCVFPLGSASAPHCCCRLLGNYGVYSSVQYLSLSDVTVLTFITPILTGLAGAVFLREPLSVRVALAGCKHF
jgi:drug/metabolite transporter (DMT)-like permease